MMLKSKYRLSLAGFVLMTAWTFAAAVSQAAGACPNENIRLSQIYGAQLPGCRAYEQVSPVAKNLGDVIGRTGITQVSPDGKRVTFGSVVPFPGIPGSAGLPVYLAERAADGSGWSTQGLLPPTPSIDPREVLSPPVGEVDGLTEDLSYALGVSGAVNLFNYLYNASDHQFLPFPPISKGFVDASSDDSTMLLESSLSLLSEEGSIEGSPNLYEWKAGQLRLVAADAVAGPDVEGSQEETYAEHTVSADGSRVFYTYLEPHQNLKSHQKFGPHQIVMRENLGAEFPVSEGSAEWRAATPDGSSVFYTEGMSIPLQVPGNLSGTSIGGGLYRWTKYENKPAQITTIAKPSASVLGTLGISNDGTYVYFVAEGEKLADNKNAIGKEAKGGLPNLYEWHEEGPGRYSYTYIATLAGHGGFDVDDWVNFYETGGGGVAEGLRTAQVTPNGRVLMFTSLAPLTVYSNPKEVEEIFRYDAASSELTCVSCNPLSTQATSGAYLSVRPLALGDEPAFRKRPFATHYMSEDGQQIFFETEESLLHQDKNSLMDVYEWESSHLYLISCGCGSYSYLGGASADGRDVFFFTRKSLVAQDHDENFDLYDAREDGGILSQNDVGSSPCANENECEGAIAAPPPFGTPASVAYSGPGNVASVLLQTSITHAVKKGGSKQAGKPKCRRGYQLNKHRKCVKVKISSRHRHRL
jgi:hypothetical protein